MRNSLPFSNILVVGDTGLLGQSVVRFARSRTSVFGCSTSIVNNDPRFNYPRFNLKWPLSTPQEWENIIVKNKIDLIINAAACASIPECESNVAAARQINVDFPAFLAQLCLKHHVAFVHISSDQVFDGKFTQPYTETDKTGPLNQYGHMKVDSELPWVCRLQIP